VRIPKSFIPDDRFDIVFVDYVEHAGVDIPANVERHPVIGFAFGREVEDYDEDYDAANVFEEGALGLGWLTPIYMDEHGGIHTPAWRAVNAGAYGLCRRGATIGDALPHIYSDARCAAEHEADKKAKKTS